MTPATAPQDATPDTTPDLPDVYFLESIEQLQVLAEPLRYRMALLLDAPATCAGLARALGLSRAKAHYHLKLLEQVGLVRPHSEALNNGIVEKYYIVRGRMLDFSRLMPRSDDALPANVAPETVSAISAFLAAMLQVSGEKTRSVTRAETLEHSHYFDFEATIDADDFHQIRKELAAIRQRILDRSRSATAPSDGAVRFHITNYLTHLE